MFYCMSCENRLGWPEGIRKSYGHCEVCDNLRVCSDVSSKYLPKPEPIEDDYSI